MYYDIKCIKQQENEKRYINPNDIMVPPGFQVEVFAEGLNTPIGIDIMENGDMVIADSGMLSGNPKVILYSKGVFSVIAEGFHVPITGITYYNKKIYVSHKGVITLVDLEGNKQDIIKGLPSYGDFYNNKVTFNAEGKMYFGQGTATNSGVVGLDNEWIEENSYFHDIPGSYIMLNGQNFVTKNILTPLGGEATTGAFSHFGVPNLQKYEIIKGSVLATGSILRANSDGTEIEQVAWGFRNPYQLKFDQFNRLFVSNQGYDIRGSRPIANAPDEMQLIIPGTWYGWPDYSAGELISLPKFTPPNGPVPQVLFTNHPSVPPKPFSIFPPNSTVMGFDINYNANFGQIGDIYIASFGPTAQDRQSSDLIGVGHRVSIVDMFNGSVSTFAINKSGLFASNSGDGGFGRPADVKFGYDVAMYIVDFSKTSGDKLFEYFPNTGVIWKISKQIRF